MLSINNINLNLRDKIEKNKTRILSPNTVDNVHYPGVGVFEPLDPLFAMAVFQLSEKLKN